jgi:hypothetical protein
LAKDHTLEGILWDPKSSAGFAGQLAIKFRLTMTWMTKRLRYYLAWLSVPWKRFWALTFAILVEIYSRSATHESHDGIAILPLVGASRREDSARIVAALRFIKQQDLRRFRRIQREIRIVVVMTNRKSTGQYQRTGRLCLIDMIQIDKKIASVIAGLQDESQLGGRKPGRPGERIARIKLGWVSSVLIHEATHGTLESKHIPYVPTTKERIESLCNAEARRFRDSIPSGYRRLAEFTEAFQDKRA